MPPLKFDLSSLLAVPDSLSGSGLLFHSLLLLGFTLHVLAMNAVLGLAVIMLFQRLFPQKGYEYYNSSTSTLWQGLPKGLALTVNFGVVPLLFLQVLYGYLVYNAGIVMGVWWLSVMLVVMLAYYGFYIATTHAPVSSGVRTGALLIAVVLLLINAFIFVNKGTLIQDPSAFLFHAINPYGVFINFGDPQLIPRYLHMVLSCLAVGGLVLSMFASWRLRTLEKSGAPGSEMHRVSYLEDSGFHWYFYATSAQVLIGSWFLISLPKIQQRLFMGGDKIGTSLMMVGLIFVLVSLVSSRKKKLFLSVFAMLITIISMIGMRHILRLSMLEPFPAPADGKLHFSPFIMFVCAAVFTVFIIIYMLKLVFAGKPPQAGAYDVNHRGRI